MINFHVQFLKLEELNCKIMTLLVSERVTCMQRNRKLHSLFQNLMYIFKFIMVICN